MLSAGTPTSRSSRTADRAASGRVKRALITMASLPALCSCGAAETLLSIFVLRRDVQHTRSYAVQLRRLGGLAHLFALVDILFRVPANGREARTGFVFGRFGAVDVHGPVLACHYV